MLKQLAKEHFNNLYHTPPNEQDLETFAREVLSKFIEELEANKMSTVCNMGLASVIYVDKDLDDKESFNTIKERYLVNEND